jgi:hypothetical protein
LDCGELLSGQPRAIAQTGGDCQSQTWHELPIVSMTGKVLPVSLFL